MHNKNKISNIDAAKMQYMYFASMQNNLRPQMGYNESWLSVFL